MSKLLVIIDSSYIDNNLTDFPVLVTLNSGTLTAPDLLLLNDDPLKVSFIDSTTTSELYAELEFTTVTETRYWVKCPTVFSDSDTFLIFNYNLVSDNTTYIGTTGSTVAQVVWGNAYEVVYHMSQDPSGGPDAILDSTSNANHASSYGSMLSEDLLYDTNVGYYIDFDGVDDHLLSKSNIGITGNAARTMSVFARKNNDNTSGGWWERAVSYGGQVDNNAFLISKYSTNTTWGVSFWNNDFNTNITRGSDFDYIVGTYNGESLTAYVDAVLCGSIACTAVTTDTVLGVCSDYNGSYLGGHAISEVRVSSVCRTDSWVVAETASLTGQLVDLALPFIIVGNIKDIYGSPINNATIRVFHQETSILEGTTYSDSSGNFVFYTTLSDVYCVVVSFSGYLPSVSYGILSVNEGEVTPTSVNIILQVSQTVAGTSSLSGFIVKPDYVDEDLVDFPIMVHLNSDNFTEVEYTNLFTTTTGLRFNVLDNNNQYCFTEVFYHDYDNRELLLYTKLPEVSSISGTIFSIFSSDDYLPYYTGFTGSSGAQNVWDSDYVGVYHFAQIPSSTSYSMLDSTSNNRHLIATDGMGSNSVVDGVLGPAIDFDGDDDRLMSEALDYSELETEYTIETYHNFDSISSFSRIAGISFDYYCPMSVSYGSSYAYNVGVWADDASAISNFELGTWSYTAVTRADSIVGLIVNGEEDPVTNTTSIQSLDSVNLWFGYDARAITTTSEHFDGKINNAKISKIKRSVPWIRAMYYGIQGLLVERVSVTACRGTVNYPNAVLRMYLRSTGELIDETVPNDDGSFALNSLHFDEHYVVALHTESNYNALIYDYITPENIGGN